MDFLKKNYMILLYAVITVLVAIQQYYPGPQHYNNFLVFKCGVFHFFKHMNMYVPYPEEHFDYFYYTPSFPVLFTPFAYLPTFIGIMLWIALIMAFYYYALKKLPLPEKSLRFIFWFTLMELITSVQNLQSNPLTAATIVLAFLYIERDSFFKASFMTNLAFFIKGYGAISGIFYFMRTPKIKSFLFLLFWFAVIGCLPLLFYSPSEFVTMYRQWNDGLGHKHDVTIGISVMGIVLSLFFPSLAGKDAQQVVIIIQVIGILCFIATSIYLSVTRKFDRVKYAFLGYTMIWVVIFNHAAESATFIISTLGTAIWYVTSRKSTADKALVVLAFILAVLSPTDLFPKYLRVNYVVPYSLKALPGLLIWLKLQYEFITMKRDFTPAASIA